MCAQPRSPPRSRGHERRAAPRLSPRVLAVLHPANLRFRKSGAVGPPWWSCFPTQASLSFSLFSSLSDSLARALSLSRSLSLARSLPPSLPLSLSLALSLPAAVAQRGYRHADVGAVHLPTNACMRTHVELSCPPRRRQSKPAHRHPNARRVLRTQVACPCWRSRHDFRSRRRQLAGKSRRDDPVTPRHPASVGWFPRCVRRRLGGRSRPSAAWPSLSTVVVIRIGLRCIVSAA